MISWSNAYPALATGVGGGLTIAAIVGLSLLSGIALLIVPFTTSIVLVIAAPESMQAQTRNTGEDPWLAAFAVGLRIAAMPLTDTLRPPAGINTLLMVAGKVA
jgi:hypothetical protein